MDIATFLLYEVDDKSWRGTNEGLKLKAQTGWLKNGIGFSVRCVQNF